MKPLFVQVKCNIGHMPRVSEAIVDEIAETSEIYSTSGDYDLLVKFYLEEAQDVSCFVTETLHSIPGIRDTRTLIAFRLFVS